MPQVPVVGASETNHGNECVDGDPAGVDHCAIGGLGDGAGRHSFDEEVRVQHDERSGGLEVVLLVVGSQWGTGATWTALRRLRVPPGMRPL